MKNEFSVAIPVESIERSGLTKTINANANECAALADRFDLVAIDKLEATLTVNPNTSSYHITGKLSATVQQKSIISGESLPTEINQDIDTYYTDYSRITSFDAEKRKRENSGKDDEHEIRDERDEPEAIINGLLDLGEIAAQFLGLALDDYPKGDDEISNDYIEVKPEDAKPNPFAKLKDLNVKK